MSKKIKTLKEKWLRDITYNGGYVEVVEDIHIKNEQIQNSFKFNIYTNNYKYNIVCIDEKNNGGYLGCIVSSRKPRAGESWTRGNDLPDGKFNYKTWKNIINSIIKYELIKIEKPQIQILDDSDCCNDLKEIQI